MIKNCLSLNYGRADENLGDVYACELNSCTKEGRLMLVSPDFDYYELVNENEVMSDDTDDMWVNLVHSDHERL